MPSTAPLPILLVEDDPAIREAIAECLESEGYGVCALSHGGEALQWLRSERPSLIILDLVMPVVNGAEVLDRLRADGALREVRDVPVVLMTAAAPSHHDPIPHADAILMKPFELDQLLSLVALHYPRAECAPASARTSSS